MAKPDIVGEINAFNSPAGVVEQYGGSIGRAAAAIAGIQYGSKGMSKNKGYLSARRSLERQLSGQYKKPSKALQAKIGKAVAKGGRIGITFTGTVAVNGRGEDYESERDIDRVYDEDEWERLSEMAAAGDEDGIWDLVADEYGVSSFELIDGDISIGEE
jgi:hypothetical protein